MPIQRYSYSTNSGAIAYIRMDTAKKAVDPSTAPTADPVDPNFYVSVSKSRRSQGLKARQVTIGKDFAVTGSTALKYVKKVNIPCLTVAGFNTLAGTSGSSISYKGESGYRVIGAATEG